MEPHTSKRNKDDYDIIGFLDEGSISSVLLCKEKTTKKQYAMKLLDKKQVVRENKVKYVHSEKNIWMKLDHPFIVKLYYTFQDVSCLCKNTHRLTKQQQRERDFIDGLDFISEYAIHGDLLKWIKRYQKFDLKTTRFYAAELVSAMEYLHSMNIIHR
jgi:3-phosphoinositide dependent protein kinase-1